MPSDNIQAPRLHVGFIGLGNMGAPMAANLRQAGFALTVFDLDRTRAEALVAQGAQWAPSPAALAAAVDIVCTSLPGPPQFEDVINGTGGGLLAALRPGALLIDFTTNSPLVVRRVQAALAARSAALLDAPVSGGVTGARSRRLTMQVGGDAADFARARPVFDAVADTVLHVGASGAGCTVKILHNCAVFGANLATVECLTAGIKAGVDPATLIQVFQKSGLGRNHDLNVALPARLFCGNFEPHFAMKTALKDMRLALELARSVEVPMPVAELAARDMADVVARGLGDRDENIYLTLQEERAGVQVRVAPRSPATASQTS